MSLASPSPSLSRSNQKTAYVLAVNLNYEIEFYSVAINPDVSGGEEDGSARVLTPIKAVDVPLHGGFAALENKLYCMGGDPPDSAFTPGSIYQPVSSFYTLDLDTISRLPTKYSWNKLAPMRVGRLLPETVVVDGKIFVFMGCVDRLYPLEWAEVFDTKSGSWSPLPPPPQVPTGYGLFAVALTGIFLGKFLVGSCCDEFFYTYHVGDGHWEHWENKMGDYFGIPCNVKPVAVGTTLFWFSCGNLHAYDWMDKWSCSTCIKDLDKVVPLKSLIPPDDHFFYPAVHYVADNVFSLLCLECFSFKHQAGLLHCVEFSISVKGGEDVCLDAAVRSSKAYAIQTPMKTLGAVIMDDGGSKDA